jgi:hypothetical protein
LKANVHEVLCSRVFDDTCEVRRAVVSVIIGMRDVDRIDRRLSRFIAGLLGHTSGEANRYRNKHQECASACHG